MKAPSLLLPPSPPGLPPHQFANSSSPPPPSPHGLGNYPTIPIPLFRGQKVLSLNTGFMVLRSCEVTRKFLTRFWNLVFLPDAECPITFTAEQGKMNGCLLPYMTPGLDYFALPCDSFNGYGGGGRGAGRQLVPGCRLGLTATS